MLRNNIVLHCRQTLTARIMRKVGATAMPLRDLHQLRRKSGRAKDDRGVDLISDALPFGRPWYTKVADAIEYAKVRSRSDNAVIRVYDEAGKRNRDAGAHGPVQSSGENSTSLTTHLGVLLV